MRLLRPIVAPLAAALLLALGAFPADARLLIEIDKSSQRMTVLLDGAPLYRWPVSTGAHGYDTPSGTFTPFRMARHHFSKEWDNAPMPNSIFFTKVGHAIHGTEHLRAIGRPVSHGCVRLEPRNARALFALVKREGMANTRVVLEGVTPAPRAPMVARRPGIGERTYRDERRHRDEREYRIDQGTGYRTGYWVQYPDGTRVFYDQERDPRSLPPLPFFLGGPFGRD